MRLSAASSPIDPSDEARRIQGDAAPILEFVPAALSFNLSKVIDRTEVIENNRIAAAKLVVGFMGSNRDVPLRPMLGELSAKLSEGGLTTGRTEVTVKKNLCELFEAQNVECKFQGIDGYLTLQKTGNGPTDPYYFRWRTEPM